MTRVQAVNAGGFDGKSMRNFEENIEGNIESRLVFSVDVSIGFSSLRHSIFGY